MDWRVRQRLGARADGGDQHQQAVRHVVKVEAGHRRSLADPGPLHEGVDADAIPIWLPVVA